MSLLVGKKDVRFTFIFETIKVNF